MDNILIITVREQQKIAFLLNSLKNSFRNFTIFRSKIECFKVCFWIWLCNAYIVTSYRSWYEHLIIAISRPIVFSGLIYGINHALLFNLMLSSALFILISFKPIFNSFALKVSKNKLKLLYSNLYTHYKSTPVHTLFIFTASCCHFAFFCFTFRSFLPKQIVLMSGEYNPEYNNTFN